MVSKRVLSILKKLQTFNRDELEEIRYAAETELFELDIKEGLVGDPEDFFFEDDDKHES